MHSASTSTVGHSSSDRYLSEYADAAADSWDDIVDWTARAEVEGRFFIDKLRQLSVRSVCDVACGTGFHSVVLARAGFDVTAVDGSPDMVSTARTNLQSAGLPLPVFCCDWRMLSEQFASESFDAVVCLGNSIAHVFDKDTRLAVLGQFLRMLKSGGVLVFDHRNYDALRLEKRHEQSGSYCCCKKGTRIEVELTAQDQAKITYRSETGKQRQIVTYPISTNMICAELTAVGFRERTTYGDLSKTLVPQNAEFLVHFCSKQ